MGHRHQTEGQTVLGRFQGALGIQGSLFPVCQAEYHYPVQTDHPGPGMVRRTAGTDGHHVHDCFRRYCRYSYGWRPQAAVLSGGYGDVDLFLFMPYQDIQYVCFQFRHFWKSVFPATDHAGRRRDQQSAQTWNSVGILCDRVCRLCPG